MDNSEKPDQETPVNNQQIEHVLNESQDVFNLSDDENNEFVRQIQEAKKRSIQDQEDNILKAVLEKSKIETSIHSPVNNLIQTSSTDDINLKSKEKIHPLKRPHFDNETSINGFPAKNFFDISSIFDMPSSSSATSSILTPENYFVSNLPCQLLATSISNLQQPISRLSTNNSSSTNDINNQLDDFPTESSYQEMSADAKENWIREIEKFTDKGYLSFSTNECYEFNMNSFRLIEKDSGSTSRCQVRGYSFDPNHRGIASGPFIYLPRDYASKEVAIKFIQNKSRNDRNQTKNDQTIYKVLKEVYYFKKLSVCPEVINFYGWDWKEDKITIAMELMACSIRDLYKMIHLSDASFDVNHLCEFIGRTALSITNALIFLKKENVMHRDIKPGNMLINHNGLIKLCDFGESRMLADSEATTSIGTFAYWAPERFDNPNTTKYGHRSDIWSLGMSLLEIAYGKMPLDDLLTNNELLLKNNFVDLMRVIKTFNSAEFIQKCQSITIDIANFIRYCLHKDKLERDLNILTDSDLYKKWKEKNNPRCNQVWIGILKPYIGDRELNSRTKIIIDGNEDVHGVVLHFEVEKDQKKNTIDLLLDCCVNFSDRHIRAIGPYRNPFSSLIRFYQTPNINSVESLDICVNCIDEYLINRLHTRSQISEKTFFLYKMRPEILDKLNFPINTVIATKERFNKYQAIIDIHDITFQIILYDYTYLNGSEQIYIKFSNRIYLYIKNVNYFDERYDCLPIYKDEQEDIKHVDSIIINLLRNETNKKRTFDISIIRKVQKLHSKLNATTTVFIVAATMYQKYKEAVSQEQSSNNFLVVTPSQSKHQGKKYFGEFITGNPGPETIDQF